MSHCSYKIFHASIQDEGLFIFRFCDCLDCNEKRFSPSWERLSSKRKQSEFDTWSYRALGSRELKSMNCLFLMSCIVFSDKGGSNAEFIG